MANRLPLIRYSMARPFVDVIVRAGVDPEPVLWANNLDPEQLNDDDAFVPTQRWYDFTEAAANELGNPYLGYQVGARSVLSSLPHMRVLQFPDATLGELLTTLVINSARMGTSARYDLKTDGRWTELTTRRTFRPTRPPAQIDAFFLGFMVQLLRACTGDAWNINDVMTTVCDRSAVPPGEVPRNRLKAGSLDGTAFHFPAVWLVKRTGGVLRQSGLVAPSVEGGFVDDLREVLRLRFADSELSLAVVANEAARSVSTLRRALQRADTSFRRELDSVRSSAACQMLALSDKSISGIGADVGYPDAASFNRAFRRWKGVTPGEFRRTLPAG